MLPYEHIPAVPFCVSQEVESWATFESRSVLDEARSIAQYRAP